MKNRKFYEEKSFKYKMLLDCTSDWLMINQNGKSLVEFFIDNKMKKIAIYGYGTLGQMLFHELKDSDIEVEYIIEKKYLKYNSQEVKFIGVDEKEYKNIDAIIITAIADFSEIETKISKRTEALIFSLEDVIYYLKAEVLER